MKFHENTTLNGFVTLANGPLEMAKAAAQIVEADAHGQAADNANGHCRHGSWTGRTFESFEQVVESFGRPWHDGLAKVREFVNELRGHVPPPRARKRRARWSEFDGEPDADRVLAGEPAFFREVKRDDIHGPTTIALLANIGGNAEVGADAMFWRSAATVAAVDLLESAGYSCEVWVWSRAVDVYGQQAKRVRRTSKASTLKEHFQLFRLKDAGEPVDIDTLTNGLSSWFFRVVMLVMFYAHRVRPRVSKGRSTITLDGWREYLDLSTSVRLLEIPADTLDRQSALEAVRTLIQSVNEKET